MGKDWPDWGQSYTNTAFYPLLDHGELAARLGTPMIYDRRGSLIWYDGFQYGLTDWQAYETSGADNPILVNDPIHSKPFACRLNPPEVEDDFGGITKSFHLPNTKAVGISAMYYAASGTGILRHRIYYRDGSTSWLAQLRFDRAASGDTFHIYTPDGAIQILSSVSEAPFASRWAFIKLVVNLDDLKYERAVIGRHDLDLSDHSLYNSGSTNKESVDLYAYVMNVGASALYYYIDDIIVTINEL